MSVQVGVIYDGGDESSLGSRAYSSFFDDESSALHGTVTLSAETMDSQDRSSAILYLASTDPDRFLSLVARLTPILQDILIQYYLLGRTYAQIGRVLFSANPPNTRYKWVRIGNHCGVKAIASLLSVDGDTGRLVPGTAEHRAWVDQLSWGATSHRALSIAIHYHRSLGDFVIRPNGQLPELFAPSWSVLHNPPAGKTLSPRKAGC